MVVRAKDFRAVIAAHRDSGTCYICGKPVVDGEAYHGATGAHWDCHAANETTSKQAVERGDEALRSLGFKPRKPRKPEGQGATALKAKAMAVSAIEQALGEKLFDVTLWNQKGVYRGARWDLDQWGLAFKFIRDGHTFAGQASSLSGMTACARAKAMKATPDRGIAFAFSIDPA